MRLIQFPLRRPAGRTGRRLESYIRYAPPPSSSSPSSSSRFSSPPFLLHCPPFFPPAASIPISRASLLRVDDAVLVQIVCAGLLLLWMCACVGRDALGLWTPTLDLARPGCCFSGFSFCCFITHCKEEEPVRGRVATLPPGTYDPFE